MPKCLIGSATMNVKIPLDMGGEMKSELYEKDFYRWTQEQAELLRAGKLSDLDVENLLEEVESMGRSEKRALRSMLEQITSHLLKLQLSTAVNPRDGWIDEVINFRTDAARWLAETPSLNHFVSDLFDESWSGAVAKFNKSMREHGESVRAPSECPFTLKQVLDDDFWPSRQ